MLSTDRLCMGCMNDNGGERVCPICGFVAGTQNAENCLPIQSFIDSRFLVGKATEENGEGITYIGWDTAENHIVQIREYFPVPLSLRRPDNSVDAKEGSEYAFNAGLMDFLALGKKLQEVSLAAVLPVIETVEENNTAYRISVAASGIVLREFLLRNGGMLTFESARPLFMPLITALISLHQNGILHGGISPETILVGRDGKLRLIGFSTAALRQSGTAINAQIFPGYAAIEQYRGEPITESTDVYGLAATLFRVLMGSNLPEATERLEDDRMNVPAKIADALPKAVLAALANALQILPENRTATMEEFRLDLAPALDTTGNFVPVSAPKNPQENEKTGSEKAKSAASKKKKTDPQTARNRRYVLMSAGITAGVFVVLAVVVWFTLLRIPKQAETPASSDSSLNSSENQISVISSTEKLLSVPDFTGKNMTIEDVRKEYADFKFEVLGKKYSAKAAGVIVGQDQKSGTEVPRDTTIYLTISLGPETLSVPSINGKTKEEALIALFEKGFLYQNIEIYEMEDESVDYHCVVKTDPAVGSSVSPDSKLTIYISKTKKQAPAPSSSSSANSSENR